MHVKPLFFSGCFCEFAFLVSSRPSNKIISAPLSSKGKSFVGHILGLSAKYAYASALVKSVVGLSPVKPIKLEIKVSV